MISRALAVLLIAAVALLGCKEKQPTAPQGETADRALLDDPVKASAEFLNRLNRGVQRQDGLIYVDERLGNLDILHAFPPNVVWHLQCGSLGLSVAFGGNGENDSEGVEEALTGISISKDQCRELLPPLGQRLIEIGGRWR